MRTAGRLGVSVLVPGLTCHAEKKAHEWKTEKV